MPSFLDRKPQPQIDVLADVKIGDRLYTYDSSKRSTDQTPGLVTVMAVTKRYIEASYAKYDRKTGRCIDVRHFEDGTQEPAFPNHVARPLDRSNIGWVRRARQEARTERHVSALASKLDLTNWRAVPLVTLRAIVLLLNGPSYAKPEGGLF